MTMSALLLPHWFPVTLFYTFMAGYFASTFYYIAILQKKRLKGENDRGAAGKTVLLREQRFRSLVERNNDIIAVMDVDQKLLYRSPSACRITGYTNEEINRMNNIDNMHPDDHAAVLLAMDKAMSLPGEPVHLQYRSRHKQGHWLDMEGTLINLLDDPAVGGLVFNFRDVTQRVKQRQQLHTSEARYRDALDNMLEGVQIISGDWTYLYINEAAAAHVKQQREHLLGQKMTDIFPAITTTDLFKQCKRCITEQVPIQLENEFKFADGSIGWFELSIRPVPEGIFILSIDITEKKKVIMVLEENLSDKKKMAERMASIINTLPANIALLDKDGIIVEVNQAWKNFAVDNGYLGNTFCVGDNYAAKAGALSEAITCVVRQECAEFIHEYRCDGHDKKRWFRMVVTPLAGMESPGAVVMHIDISEIRQLEQERMDARMEDQKKIKQALLRGQERERNAIGVELHDNVNQVLAGTGLLLSMVKSNPEKTGELIPVCVEQIKMAIEENRKIAHKFWSPDMVEGNLVLQLERLFSTMLEPAGIKGMVVADNFEEDVLDNEQKINIYRIAQEQCNNIVKYSCAQTAVIHLQNSACNVLMHMKDDGIGMECHQKIKGIGLNNIRGRLSIFNGSVRIETSPGKGFALYITMPVSNVCPGDAPESG